MYKFRDFNYREPNIVFKILVIGDGASGKSSILYRYCDNTFYSNYISTIGVDFKIKHLEVNKKYVKLQIWDTAGQERFKSITTAYYRGVNGILLIYDVTNRESFDNIKLWINSIGLYAPSDVFIVLIGNKSDSTKRNVKIEEGIALANELKIPFLETSAKDNINIDNAFQLLIDKLTYEINDPLLTIPHMEIVKVEEKSIFQKWCNLF